MGSSQSALYACAWQFQLPFNGMFQGGKEGRFRNWMVHVQPTNLANRPLLQQLRVYMRSNVQKSAASVCVFSLPSPPPFVAGGIYLTAGGQFARGDLRIGSFSPSSLSPPLSLARARAHKGGGNVRTRAHAVGPRGKELSATLILAPRPHRKDEKLSLAASIRQLYLLP